MEACCFCAVVLLHGLHEGSGVVVVNDKIVETCKVAGLAEAASVQKHAQASLFMSFHSYLPSTWCGEICTAVW